jgi:hypothetical protein
LDINALKSAASAGCCLTGLSAPGTLRHLPTDLWSKGRTLCIERTRFAGKR